MALSTTEMFDKETALKALDKRAEEVKRKAGLGVLDDPDLLINTPLKKIDPGAHYRYTFMGYKVDPFRIAKIYSMTDFALMTILKKCLCAGNRGSKDKIQDLKDIISAAERAIELEEED